MAVVHKPCSQRTQHRRQSSCEGELTVAQLAKSPLPPLHRPSRATCSATRHSRKRQGVCSVERLRQIRPREEVCLEAPRSNLRRPAAFLGHRVHSQHNQADCSAGLNQEVGCLEEAVHRHHYQEEAYSGVLLHNLHKQTVCSEECLHKQHSQVACLEAATHSQAAFSEAERPKRRPQEVNLAILCRQDRQADYSHPEMHKHHPPFSLPLNRCHNQVLGGPLSSAGPRRVTPPRAQKSMPNISVLPPNSIS